MLLSLTAGFSLRHFLDKEVSAKVLVIKHKRTGEQQWVFTDSSSKRYNVPLYKEVEHEPWWVLVTTFG